MKLYGKELEKDGGGTVHIETEDTEDLWHLYNLILPGDPLFATTCAERGGATADCVMLRVLHRILVDFGPCPPLPTLHPRG